MNLEIDGKKVMELKPVKFKPTEEFRKTKIDLRSDDANLRITLSNGKEVDIPITWEKMLEIRRLSEEKQ